MEGLHQRPRRGHHVVDGTDQGVTSGRPDAGRPNSWVVTATAARDPDDAQPDGGDQNRPPIPSITSQNGWLTVESRTRSPSVTEGARVMEPTKIAPTSAASGA